MTHKLKFIDSFRFMNTSISDFVDNLSEIYKKESKGCEERRKIKSASDTIGLKNNKLNHKWKECKERWLKLPNIHQFGNGDIDKFVLLIRKGVYSYKYMDSWERFNETSLPDKKSFLQRIKFRRHF